jgi:hypothetical protein
MDPMDIHPFLVSTIYWVFGRKIHTFWLPRYIRGFLGPATPPPFNYPQVHQELIEARFTKPLCVSVQRHIILEWSYVVFIIGDVCTPGSPS